MSDDFDLNLNVKSLPAKLKQFCIECGRVLRITKKPTRDELKIIVKVSGFGILIIGFIGFIIQLLAELF